MIPCKKCLLADIDPEGVYKRISELIALIPDEDRTTSAEYERRLSICRSCEDLNAGTCAVCGCYVELRAAKSPSVCPHENRRW